MEDERNPAQSNLKFTNNQVIYNGRKISYFRFLEETVLETFFLLIMDYADELTDLKPERTFESIFNEAFCNAFLEISRQYEVPEFVADSFSAALLDEKAVNNTDYKKYMNDVKKNTLNLMTMVSLN